jgi:hypothetical protein
MKQNNVAGLGQAGGKNQQSKGNTMNLELLGVRA